MLKVIPNGWCSWDFRIEDRNGMLATIDMAWLGERAEILIQNEPYQFQRASVMGGTFRMTHDGDPVAVAKKRMMIRTFDVESDGRHFEVGAMHMFGRSFGLFEKGRQIGTVRPVSMWRRTAHVTFPEDIPLDVQVFLIWLVLILWRREEAAAG